MGEVTASEKRSMTEAAYQVLKREIIHGELPPGFQALEEDIATRLGMSRTPVREALILLANEGFLDIIPRRGMRVRPFSVRDILEINEVLGCLEAEAAEQLASRQASPAEIARLEAAIAEMDRALDNDDMQAWAEADYGFHCLLIELCGNRHLTNTARLFLDKAHRYRLLTISLRARPVYSNVNHAAVVEAIRRGDAQTALEIHRGHKRRWQRELAELLHRLEIPE